MNNIRLGCQPIQGQSTFLGTDRNSTRAVVSAKTSSVPMKQLTKRQQQLALPTYALTRLMQIVRA